MAGVVAGEAGVNARDAKAEGSELRGLVIHQGDERGDDKGGAGFSGGLPGDGWELIAERFARAGGHYKQDVAADGCGLANDFLIGAEGREAEGVSQQMSEIGHCSGSGENSFSRKGKQPTLSRRARKDGPPGLR